MLSIDYCQGDYSILSFVLSNLIESMSLFASFIGLPCPICHGMIMVSGIYYDKTEPEPGVTTCEYCKTELQVSKDPVTGKMFAERVKRN